MGWRISTLASLLSNDRKKKSIMLKCNVYPGVWMRTAQGNFCWGRLHHWKERDTWNSFLPKSLRSSNNLPTGYLSIAYKINLFYISFWKFLQVPCGNLFFLCVDSCPEALETKYLFELSALLAKIFFFSDKAVTGKWRCFSSYQLLQNGLYFHYDHPQSL